MAKVTKTNAMRILDSDKINYNVKTYPSEEAVAATEVAKYLEQPVERVFKTLVTTDGNRGYYVFCIPGEKELDLKAGAKVAGVKKIEMLKQKELLPLTGYIHGGCSPIGMKKLFPTFIDESALNYDTIFVSGGKIGLQIELKAEDIKNVTGAKFESVTKI